MALLLLLSLLGSFVTARAGPEMTNVSGTGTNQPSLRGAANFTEHLVANGTESTQRPLFVGNGQTISQTEWDQQYDFVVQVLRNGRSWCSGWIQGSIVMTASHCVPTGSRPEEFTVNTAKGLFTVWNVIPNSMWNGKARDGHDIVILQLREWFKNNVPYHLSQDRPHDSTELE